MKLLRFNGLFNAGSWMSPCFALLDEKGRLCELRRTKHIGDPPEEKIEGLAVPGLINAHSHAFQYAMAGTAEGNAGTDFWDWRKRMYQLAAVLNPDVMEAIARMVYLEMLKHGFTHVVEFHYVHHDPKGRPYDDPAEMGARLIRAARYCGLGITLVPVYYKTGDFGLPAQSDQQRFVSGSVEDYFLLLEACERHLDEGSETSLGWGVHSLRAASTEDIIRITKQLPDDTVFHIHIAEQVKEVQACLAFHGCRPVELMLEHMDANERYFFVHATHISEKESKQLATTGAGIVLCPSTEANLGDGLFDMPSYAAHGGRWCIGTDSHVGLDPLEELRWLDYGQRLRSLSRKMQYSGHSGGLATQLLNESISTGRRSAGLSDHAGFAIGQSFDALLLDDSMPSVRTSSSQFYLPTLLYATQMNAKKGTLIGGEMLIDSGCHPNEDAIISGYITALRELGLRN